MTKRQYTTWITVIIGIIFLYFLISFTPYSYNIPSPIFPPSTTPTPTSFIPPDTTIQPPPLPTDSPAGTVTLGEGQREGSLLVQKIYSDHIEGLNFREYPVMTLEGQPITLYIGQNVSNGCTVTMTLINLIQLQTYPPINKAVFTKVIEANRPCPICLSENTTIDTSFGYIPVKSIKTGDIVWTTDNERIKQRATILKTSKVQVKDHQMSHIILANGYHVYASPNHPLGDGRPIGTIVVGDTIDNSEVVIAELVPYSGQYTYDILPSGDTGTYLANGILLKSTLFS